MWQALHIFKKDVGLLRYHIALTLVAMVAFCLAGIFNVNGAGPTAFILPVTWWFLIAAAIHAEPLTGRGHFWLTRPYRRRSLLCAKALFIFAFVNIPILIADGVIIHATGFSVMANIGGFIWTQVLLIIVFEIPAAAISAITSSFLELLVATLSLILAWLLCLLVIPVTHIGFSWTGLEWIRNYYLFGLVAIGATIIVLCQYFYRITLATRIAAALAPLLLLGSTALLSWTTAFQLQMHFSRQAVDTSSARIHLDSKRKWASRVYLDDHENVIAEIPIQVDDLPLGTQLKPFGVTMTLFRPNGQIWVVKTPPPDSFEYDSDALSLRLVMPKAVYENLKGEPIRVHGNFYFSLFKNCQITALPLDTRAYIYGLGFCAATRRLLLCNSAFRYPRNSAEVTLTQESIRGSVRSTEQLSRLGSSSPFPADFNINPAFRLSSPRLVPISDVLIKSSEPITYSKQSFDIAHLVLGEFAFRN